MRIRISLCLAVLFLAVPLLAAKRRSVTSPGGTGCGVPAVIDPRATAATWVAIDETNVYYFDDADRAVYRISKNGGQRTELAELEGFVVFDIALDESNVYIAAIPEAFDDTPLPGSIFTVPKSGGTYRTLVAGVIVPYELAVDATHVYWVSVGTFAGEDLQSDGKIERVRKDGTGRQTLAEGLSVPLTFAIDDSNVFYSELGAAIGNTSAGIRRVPKGGGAVVKVTDDFVALGMTLTGTDILYAGEARDGFSGGGILRLAKTGGTSEWLVHDDGLLGGPRLFDGQIYYVTTSDDETQDNLMRLPLAGGTPQFLRVPEMNEYDFAIDTCGIYYGTYDGPLVRTPR
jgi:hypothetical protein